MSDSILKFTQKQKETVVSIMQKLEKEKLIEDNLVILVDFDYLYKIFNDEEKMIFDLILNIKPKKHEIKAPFLGIKPVSKKLISYKNQKYTWEKEEKEIATQYLPESTHEALKNMNKALYDDLSLTLLVKSGYRSPAYQIFVFLYYLLKNEYDFEKTLKQIALPGYSEHGFPKSQAIDFITETGIIFGDKINFDKTKEYEWLLENAQKFDFYLSYPKDNKYGMAFEPWHWHFSK